jgi:hypothetical protein
MTVASFFSGIACLAFAASGVFFLKFWRASRDPFFLHFSAACWLLSLERIAGLVYEVLLSNELNRPEAGIWSYVIRLIAFIVIFVGILRKNQATRSDSN